MIKLIIGYDFQTGLLLGFITGFVFTTIYLLIVYLKFNHKISFRKEIKDFVLGMGEFMHECDMEEYGKKK